MKVSMLLLRNYRLGRYINVYFLTLKNRMLLISKRKHTKTEPFISPYMQRVRDVNSQLFIFLSFEVN